MAIWNDFLFDGVIQSDEYTDTATFSVSIPKHS